MNWASEAPGHGSWSRMPKKAAVCASISADVKVALTAFLLILFSISGLGLSARVSAPSLSETKYNAELIQTGEPNP